MAMYPGAQAKAQAEIDRVTGGLRLPGEYRRVIGVVIELAVL